MMGRLLIFGALIVGDLAAQTAVTNASVSGVVKDKTTGKPLGNYAVSTMVNVTWVGETVLQNKNSKDLSVTTDSSGRYTLTDLPPGSYRIDAGSPQHFGISVTRHVVVNGSDVENIDFQILLPATIAGKVIDENKEPVSGVLVRLVKREYYLGSPGYYYGFVNATTNDLGEFIISGIEPGRPYLVMAEKVERGLPAHSAVPLDPKLRKRTPVRTFYPNSPAPEGAEAVILQPGEKRESVDIEMKKSPSYCVEGTVAGPMGTGKLRFGIEATQPSNGMSSTGGTFGMAPGGVTAADGKFRICDLYPAVYRLSVQDGDDNPPTPSYGQMEIAIGDRDLQGVTLTAVPGKPLPGEVAWDGEPPARPVANRVSVSLVPLYRSTFSAERTFVRADVPGPFTIDSVFPDEYGVRALFNVPGMYVKDVTFSGRSVMSAPLRPAAAMSGSGLRVVIAHDGATLSVQVTGKDGNPGIDLHVLVIPAEVRSEGELAARLVQGKTNQLGQYATQTLPPGKYYVVAADELLDPTPESIGRLWKSRTRFQEVDLPPAGAAQVKLEPGTIGR
jgi:hypothetical protein